MQKIVKETNTFWAVNKTWIGSDGIGLTKPGSDRTGLTKPGSGWILLNKPISTHWKWAHFKFPLKNGQVVSLDQDDEERSRKWLPLHCLICFFLLHSVVMDWLFIVMHLNYTSLNDHVFLERERSKQKDKEE